MAKEKIILAVRDTSTGEESRLRFSSLDEAVDHARMVILGQIVDELYELALQDNPSEFKEEIETLREIAEDVNRPRDLEQLRGALEAWHEYTDDRPHNTVIEIL